MTLVIAAATVLGAAASICCAWVALRGRSLRRPHSQTMQMLEFGDRKVYVDTPRLTIDVIEQIAVRMDVTPLDVVDAMGTKKFVPIEQIGKSEPTPRINVPSWAIGLMNADDAQRYAFEWGAHLYQLVNEGQIKQARRDRRGLAFTAISLAVALRLRRVFSRAR